MRAHVRDAFTRLGIRPIGATFAEAVGEVTAILDEPSEHTLRSVRSAPGTAPTSSQSGG